MRRSRPSGSIPPALLLALLGGALASPSPGAIYLVGAGGAPCTHATIALALAAAEANAGPDEIRVTRNQAYTSQSHFLTDWSPATKGALTISGGYDNCSDGTPSGLTEIGGGVGLQPVFFIYAVSEPTSEVTFRNLTIRDSNENGVQIDAGGRVTLQGTLVTSNSASGIHVYAGELFVDVASEVSEHGASGIHCEFGSVDVAAWVHDNSGGSGGGISSLACQLNVLSQAWIVSNTALDSGGGIFAQGGVVVIDGTNPGEFETRISDNSANGFGGGIFALGGGTSVTIRNASVTANEASVGGGGIYATDGARVVMERVDGNCFNFARCSDLSSNTGGGRGAAAWANAGADIRVSQTYVDSNTLPPSAKNGSVLHASGDGSTLSVEGVGFWNNQGAVALVDANDGATFQVAFVSATGNLFANGTVSASPISLSGGATGTLASSIFYPNSPVIGAGALSVADCLIVSDSTGFSGATFLSTGNPLFTNPATGNMHLPSGSPAVDFCDSAVAFPGHPDIDHEVRGFDEAGNTNGGPGVPGGTFDIGFDEFRVLFGDGFETEDTAAWSSTVP